MTHTKHKEIMDKVKELAKEYARQYYLVSEEKAPEEDEVQALYDLETFISSALLQQLEELEGWVARKIAIHTQLSGECIGSLEEIEQGFPRNNPHTFVIEQLKQVLSHIREQKEIIKNSK